MLAGISWGKSQELRTGVRCGHGCGDGGAHGDDGKGEEGEDVLSVHVDTRSWGRAGICGVFGTGCKGVDVDACDCAIRLD